MCVKHSVQREVGVDESAPPLPHLPGGIRVIEHPQQPLGKPRNVPAMGQQHLATILQRHTREVVQPAPPDNRHSPPASGMQAEAIS